MTQKIKIRDFVIALGFEGKEAKNGLKEMETGVRRLSTALHNAFGTQTKHMGKLIGGYSRLNSVIEKRIALEKELKKIGLNAGAQGGGGSSGGRGGGESKEDKAARESIALRRAQLSLMRQENAAIRAGTTYDQRGVTSAITSGDIKRIKDLKLALEELNVAQRKTIALSRARNSLTREQERADNRNVSVIQKRTQLIRKLTSMEAMGVKDKGGLLARAMGTQSPSDMNKLLAIANQQLAYAEKRAKAREREARATKAMDDYERKRQRREEKQESFENRRTRQTASRRNELGALKDQFIDRQGKFRGGTSQTSQALRGQMAETLNVVRKMRTAKDAKELERLNAKYISLRAGLNDAARAAKRANKAFDFLRFTQKSLRESTHNLARSYVSAFALVGGAGMSINMGQELMATQAGMLMVSGSAAEAGQNMEYVTGLAAQFGTNVKESAKAFSRIKSGAESAGLSIEDTKNIFEAALEASTVFQLTQDETTGVLRAFQQILSYPLAPSYREVC